MKQIGFGERNFRKKWINLSSSSSFWSSSQISLEVFELAKMRLATHARTLKVHVTPYKDRKVSIGYDYSLYSRFVCSLSDVSRGFLTHGRPKSTPPRKCDDGRERKRAKKRPKSVPGIRADYARRERCTRVPLLFVDVVGTDVPTNADRMEREENMMIPFSLFFPRLL